MTDTRLRRAYASAMARRAKLVQQLESVDAQIERLAPRVGERVDKGPDIDKTEGDLDIVQKSAEQKDDEEEPTEPDPSPF